MDSLFDPALQFQITCHSPDEFQEKVIGWDIAHLQLTQGAYQSSVDIVHTSNMQLTKATHNVGICERGGTIPGVVIIALPLLPPGTERPYYCGSQLNEQECPILFSKGEYEILSSGAEIDFAIAVDADLLDTEAIVLTGSPLCISAAITASLHSTAESTKTCTDPIDTDAETEKSLFSTSRWTTRAAGKTINKSTSAVYHSPHWEEKIAAQP